MEHVESTLFKPSCLLQEIKHSPGKLSTAFVCSAHGFGVDVRLCVHVKGIWSFHVLPLS